MAQVFISYSRRDLSFIKQLVSDLKKTGIDVWYDLSGIEGGTRWRIEIQNAIKNSDFVIVVLSPDSIESEWVEREFLYASNLKKKILPIKYRDCDLPLSFLDLNYVDVQGESYSRNFDRIERFLDREPLTSSSTDGSVIKRKITLERTSPGMRAAVTFFAIFGVVAVFGLAAMLLRPDAGRNMPGTDSNSTNEPVATVIQPMVLTNTVLPPAMATSTNVPPTAIVPEFPPTIDSMVTSVPTLADNSNRAVFVQSATSETMNNWWTIIDHPLADDRDALVFAIPNFISPETGRGIYNESRIAVIYEVSHWAISNQGMADMPHAAAFNVQMLRPDGNTFVHMATSSNIVDYYTKIDNTLAFDPNALVFAMPNCSPPDRPRQCYNHSIGVLWTGTQWAIFHEDRSRMLEAEAFNVQILSPADNAFVHTTTSSNTRYSWTNLGSGDNPNPFMIESSSLIFVMHRISSEENSVYIDHPIGVWWRGPEWAIFNENKQLPMPEGAEFNILALQADE